MCGIGAFTTSEQSWFTEIHQKQHLAFLHDYLPYTQGLLRTKGVDSFMTGMQEGKIPYDTTYWRLIAFFVWMKVYQVALPK